MFFFKWHFLCCCCLSSLMPIPLIGSKFNNQKTINKSLEHANILLLHTFQLVLLFSGFLFPTVQDVPPNDVRQLTMKSQLFEWQLIHTWRRQHCKICTHFCFHRANVIVKTTSRPGYSHVKNNFFGWLSLHHIVKISHKVSSKNKRGPFRMTHDLHNNP